MSISVENVSKRFGATQALEGISLTFEEGKIYGLLGRNVPRYEQKTLSIT